jgi:hypothetical protein
MNIRRHPPIIELAAPLPVIKFYQNLNHLNHIKIDGSGGQI